MADLSRDALMNVVEQGIKRDIDLLLDQGGYRGAAILLFCAIDAMAYADAPAGAEKAGRSGFIKWADTHLYLAPLTSREIYGARCGYLHIYGLESDLSRDEEDVRWIAFVNDCTPPLRWNPAINPKMIAVSMRHFRAEVFRGIDRFLVAVYSGSDLERRQRVEERLSSMVHSFPMNTPSGGPKP